MNCGDPSEPNCRDAMDRAFEYLDGELSDAEFDQIQKHFVECAPCMEQHEVDAMIKALVKRGCGCENAPDSLVARIRLSVQRPANPTG